MGIFFKSKRATRNTADNNITVNNTNTNDIKAGLEMMFNFIKDMRAEIREDMGEIDKQIRRTGKRIDFVEAEVNDLRIKVAVLDKIIETLLQKGDK